MALSNCGCQLVWMRNLLNKIGFNVPISYIMVITLAYFSGDLILYKRSVPNILIFAITT